MSHVVQIQTEVRDPVAIGAAATRLHLPVPVFGEAKLFTSSKTGWAAQIVSCKPLLSYTAEPAVCRY